MEKVTDRILWTVLVLAIGVSLYVFGKPAFSNIVHGSTQQLSNLTKQWKGATSADDASFDSDFSYSKPNTKNNTISITGYSGSKENLTIPQHHKIGSVSYKVTAIGYAAFRGNTSIKQVTIPNGLTSIGGGAFYYTTLTSVDLPASVTSIGAGAFNDTQLTSVDLPAGLTSIGGGAFENTSISAISFKNRVDLGYGAFANTNLKNVTLPMGSTYKTTVNTPTFDPNVKVTFK